MPGAGPGDEPDAMPPKLFLVSDVPEPVLLLGLLSLLPSLSSLLLLLLPPPLPSDAALLPSLLLEPLASLPLVSEDAAPASWSQAAAADSPPARQTKALCHEVSRQDNRPQHAICMSTRG